MEFLIKNLKPKCDDSQKRHDQIYWKRYEKLISSFTSQVSFISITELNPVLGISYLIDEYQPRIQFIQSYTRLLPKLQGSLKKIKWKSTRRSWSNIWFNKGITGLVHAAQDVACVENAFFGTDTWRSATWCPEGHKWNE